MKTATKRLEMHEDKGEGLTNEDLAYGLALHWCDVKATTWYRYDGKFWRGWTSGSVERNPLDPTSTQWRISSPRPAEWRPWSRLLDESRRPYMRWFEGAATNVTFTALDNHWLNGRGNDVAFDCASVSSNKESYSSINRRDLLSAVCALSRCVRSDLGGDALMPLSERCLFHARTGFEQVAYILACARLGIVYTCTAVDASDAAILHRLHDLKPTLLVATADGDITPHTMPGALAESRLRELSGCPSENGLVKLFYVVSQGDVANLLLQERRKAFNATSEYELSVWPHPFAASDVHALCVVYTSGSTGKPKGVVHGHGGYAACVSRSMKYTFQTARKDKLLAVATFAWITGQSYMLMGPLLAGCTSILIEGSALGLDGLRWARIAKARRATILKIATAFVRHVMVSSCRTSALASLNLSGTLRLATFCAEPVSVDVQSWACQALCPLFFNSYWGTEHGSIVLTWRPESAHSFEPDTKCWPVPWVHCGLTAYSDSGSGGPKDIVLLRPYAGLGRTIWGDAAGYACDGGWVGDLKKFARDYFPFGTCAVRLGFGFLQGDTARVDAVDQGWTFHGRSDEVLNVSGVRVGVEEIEQALWCMHGVREVAVVGGPHAIKGEIPVAFIVPEVLKGQSVHSYLSHFRQMARVSIGPHAEPDVIVVAELPRTITGKVTRSLLRTVISSGQVATIAEAERSVSNTVAYWSCVAAAQAWRRNEVRADIRVLTSSDWDELDLDCHHVAGSAIVPATGWLELLRRTFCYISMEQVRFQREARDKFKTYVARKLGTNDVEIRAEGSRLSRGGETEQADDAVYARAVFPPSGSLPQVQGVLLSSFDLLAWNKEDVVDDIDLATHYRRCRAVGLQYTGPFACTQRVVWRVDYTFRALVCVPEVNTAALLDSALQVVCSLEALGTGAAHVPFAVKLIRFRTGAAYVPYAIKQVRFNDLDPNLRLGVVVGEIRVRTGSTLIADLAYFEASDVLSASGLDLTSSLVNRPCFAIMIGASFSRLDKTQRRVRCEDKHQSSFESELLQSTSCEDERESRRFGRLPARQEASSSHGLDHKVASKRVCGVEPQQKLYHNIIKLGESVVGGYVDPSMTLFENGLHSLRGVELVGKINSAYGISLEMHIIAAVSTFQDLAAALKRALHRNNVNAASSRSNGRFPHVNTAALGRIARARQGGLEAVNVGPKRCDHDSSLTILIRELFRAVTYMVRRGFVRYLRIQYRDGLVHFLVRPPAEIDLDLEITVPGSFVGFHQTDYNRHFTVREIVRDSERGFYNLIHASGLAHLEHYYRVMFFASRLDARFDLELLEGEPYEMRVSISAITGPLLDIDVNFFKRDPKVVRKSERAFTVTWRLMLVVDAKQKRMYDFEKGGAFVSKFARNENQHIVSGTEACLMSSEPFCRRGSRVVRVTLLFIVVVAGVAFVCTVVFPLCHKASIALRTTLASTYYSPVETLVVLSAVTLWVRVSVRPDSCDGPVQALLPHG